VSNLQTTVDALRDQVAALQESLDALSPPAQSNVRFTPTMNQNGVDGHFCNVVNVSDTTRTVRIQAIRRPTSVAPPVTVIDSTAAVEPQARFRTAAITTESFHCVFTVIDGSRADIRAAIWVQGSNTGLLAE